MPNVETLVWILGVALSVISALAAWIFQIMREEAKEQANQIKDKADNARLQEAEARWSEKLHEVEANSEKLVNKLEVRHDKEMEQLASRLGEQIRNTETNILTQIRLMIEVLKTQP